MNQPATPDIPYRLERLGTLMSPDPSRPEEVEGVLNPATAIAKDGTIRIFARLVGEGNYSRIGNGVVVVEDGVPVGVERQGIALEPDRVWESGADHGGTEDPRITWIESLHKYVMVYVAFGPLGPRPAIALSDDLETWQRLGPIQFAYDDQLGIDLNLYPNKDVVFFPEPVRSPSGEWSFAALHRPMWDLSATELNRGDVVPPQIDDVRPSIWISYVPVAAVDRDLTQLNRLTGHRVVAGSEHDWESVKVGAGPAPLRVPEGWLLLHHGVSGHIEGGGFGLQQNVRYSAGALLLDENDPSLLLARTPHPLIEPETSEETDGIVANVVFPTSTEQIDGRTFVFYGMADHKIGVAELVRVSP